MLWVEHVKRLNTLKISQVSRYSTNKDCPRKFCDKPNEIRYEQNFGVVTLKGEQRFGLQGARRAGCDTRLYIKSAQRKGYIDKRQTFSGGFSDAAFNLLDKSFSVLDKNPMIQVSFVDTVSTNIPRTLVDLKTGLAAAFETCRREFSGLFVNCLMPGLVVKGLAGILPKANELKGTNVVGSWANSDAINKFSTVYNNSGSTKEYVEKAISSLEGLDGTNWVKYAEKSSLPEFQEAVKDITTAIGTYGRTRKNLLKSAREKLAGITKAENVLRFNGKPQSNLEETLRDITDLGSKYNYVKNKTLQSIGKTAEDLTDKEVSTKVTQAIKKYNKKLNSFVNQKSLIGLAIVIAIAVSVQTINRAITRKQFNAEGAPIYKDFGKKDTTQKMDEKQKKVFFAKKLASAAGMYGLAALSMMKKPTLGMFQFSGIFPTLDQCRWIAASTFASRMMGAEDENELRETTVRDLASFSGLYFLGDYVKKGVASAMEAASKTENGAKVLGENVILLNRKKVIEKPVIKAGMPIAQKIGKQLSYRAKQFGNWIKNTELKTASEVSSIKVRNLRNLCRVADIAFSIIMLGVLLPKYNRKVTERKVEEAKKQEALRIKSQKAIYNELPSVFKDMKIK